MLVKKKNLKSGFNELRLKCY